MGIFDWVNAGLQAVGLVSEHNSQSNANRTNVRLQREQQAWEERMSNTAVQRSAKDIALAGGNPALAFEKGLTASTPSVTPARVEPTLKGGSVSNAILGVAQARNLQAQTRATNAQAKGQEIKNNIDNAFAMNTAAINYDLLEMKKQAGAKEYEKLEGEIRNAVADFNRTQALTAGTVLQNERYARMTNAVVDLAMQQARAGRIDLDALENVATVGGVEAGKANGVVRTIIDTLRVFFQNKR